MTAYRVVGIKLYTCNIVFL